MTLIKSPNSDLRPLRGRPARSQVEYYQRHVAKRYQELQELRKQFAIELKQRYPKLNSASLADIEQLILATAEEYRLWSALDNRLLSIQRHKDPIKQFSTQLHKIDAHLVQLRQTYQLILSQRHQAILPSEAYWCNANSEIINKELSRIGMQSTNDQTVTLCGITLWFETQCLKPISLNTLQRYRSFLRKALNYMVDKRIGVLFPLTSARNPGRPKLPLPIKLTRAEQALIDDYQALSNECREVQLTPITPQQLWSKYHDPMKTKVGRKPLNKNQKIQRELHRYERQLCELEQNKETLIGIARERKTKRGRRPLTYEQLRLRLLEKIQMLTSVRE
ncbi:hypothetical protein QWZ04_11520 [Vibrio tapetis subsp. quintayensis]|uniref:hypothetical protein n=1 Tax=Vibrio tapetis TaxID=52443 RepID=UPI0025B58E81|nr:hypothetical protein [Vibrio tapetis]MDN3680950.1 hypothetical protein [Vibrio tapetis subsp. quintayensis]